MTETETKPTSWRQVAREVIRDLIDDADEVSLSEVTERALSQFHGDDEFARLVIEDIRPLLYSMVQEVVAATREVRFAGVTFARKTKAGGEQVSVFARWMEHAGDRHYLLLDMTKDQVMAAAAERKGREEYQGKRRMLLEQLASTMKPNERVRERWTTLEIEQRWLLLTDKSE